MMSRRQALKKAFIATTTIAIAHSFTEAEAQNAPAPAASGPFQLPPLGYSFDALEPFIDAQTMELHHDKHHGTYVANLNKAVAAHPELGQKTVEELLSNLDSVPADVRTAVRNNGGGHLNHSLFWKILRKDGEKGPNGALASAIDKRFGSLDQFKAEFTKTALGLFGSGWVWLTLAGPELQIVPLPNQDSLLSQPGTKQVPLFGLDVWEHAYYLKHQNRRADYIAAFFNVFDWAPICTTANRLI